MRIDIGAQIGDCGIGRYAVELVSRFTKIDCVNRCRAFVSEATSFEVNHDQDWGDYCRNVEVGTPRYTTASPNNYSSPGSWPGNATMWFTPRSSTR